MVLQSFGMTHFVNPKELPEGTSTGDAIIKLIGDYPGAGVDYSFEAISNTMTMRQGTVQ